jgi:HlyD family secretion protein
LTPAKFTTAPHLWAAAVAAVMIGLVWLIWPRSLSVQTSFVDRGEVRRDLEEEGRVQIRNVYAVSAPVGGVLQRVTLDSGNQVSRGDQIAVIRPPNPSLLDARSEREAHASVLAAQSALAVAATDLELARSEERRIRVLAEKGFAAIATLERSRATAGAASAVADQRKAELRRAREAASRPKTNLSGVAVRSPATGKVLRVLQENETAIEPGATILEIGDPQEIEIAAEFLSEDAAQMREGGCAVVDGPGGEPRPARIQRVEPYARTKISALGVEEQRVKVVLKLDAAPDNALALGHGYRADVRVVMFESKNVLRAPTDALVRGRNGGWAVFRLEAGRARLTPVDIGDGDDRFRVVKGGLREGDEIILFPSDALVDGDQVRSER